MSMASDNGATITVHVDTQEAVRAIRDLREEANQTEEAIGTLLVSKRDWLPYIFGAGGWIVALVAVLLS